MKYTQVPDTSTTLLRDVASDPAHPRWMEFVSMYEPMMRGYLADRFPGLDADDLIQDTLIAVLKILPNYRHEPKHRGRFHNYLIGILRKKALMVLRERLHDEKVKKRVRGAVNEKGKSAKEQEYEDWQRSIYEIALRDFLDNDAISELRKRMFVMRMIKGMELADVAKQLNVEPQKISVSVSRSVSYLRGKISAMKEVGS